MRPRAGSVARAYDAINAVLFATAGGSGRVRQRLVDALHIRRGARVLELGCGTGQVTARLLAAGADVVAVDRLPEMLAGARRRAPAATFIVGDVLEVDAGSHFDHVVVSFMLHNFEGSDRTRILAGAAQRLKPGGTVGILDWSLPKGRVRARLWRRFVVRMEPSRSCAQILDGELPRDIAAAGLTVVDARPVAGGRVQRLVLAPAT